jgi:hypothetical protein
MVSISFKEIFKERIKFYDNSYMIDNHALVMYLNHIIDFQIFSFLLQASLSFIPAANLS